MFRFSLPVAGLLALAVALGIGRFAFTPVLPMMQADLHLTLAEGGWLASANYLGYLVGALTVTSLSWPPARLLRHGLWLVVLTTAAMGVDTHWGGWLAWRLIAGIASAWVLIGTASLCIARLNAMGHGHQSGIVFAGVGSGIAFAGLACMALTVLQATSFQAWRWLALFALLGLLAARPLWRDAAPIPRPPRNTAGTLVPRLHWGLILCYGAYGFGYIFPATFLPAQARGLVANPWLFSLAWPIFGATAALSTWFASRLERHTTLPKLWAGAQAVMAFGVLLPAIWHSLAAILIAACCVGSTFMIITMVGLQAAQVHVGAQHAKRQMAAMTASFALGQLLGPMFFSITHQWFGASLPLALALGTVVLLAGIPPILRLENKRGKPQSAR